jgi:hypothetical protein
MALQASATPLGDEAPDTTVWLQTQHLMRDDWGGYFGSEVALEGDTMVASTQHNANSDSGYADGHDRAYVFQRQPAGHWIQTDRLVPSDAGPGDTFAYALALDAEEGVVVAGNPAAGKVYVFEETATGDYDEAWVVSEQASDFGRTVAVDGSTILAGTGSGPLYVYERHDNGWTQRDVLTGATGAVDIENETLVARSAPDFHNFEVYQQTNGGWEPSADLPPPGSDEITANAVDLSRDGQTVVFGAAHDDWAPAADTVYQPIAVASTGSAWIYERVEGNWTQTSELANPDPAPLETFGTSVAVSGDRVVVGAPGDAHTGGEQSGAAYVYERTGDEWSLTTKLVNKDSTPYGLGDWFGESVDVVGSTIVVGAPFDDNRRDGSPPPLNDQGDVPPCVHPDVMWGCDTGEDDGSVYIFETLDDEKP